MQRPRHFIHQDQLVEISFADEDRVDIGRADHAFHCHDLDQLRKSDGESLAPIAEAVNIDDRRDFHAKAPGCLPEKSHVFAQITSIETAVVFDHLLSMG